MPHLAMQDALPLPYHPRDFAAQVYAVVVAIPAGRVLSYGDNARLLGHPSRSRMVGRALKYAPKGLPCHRVVDSRGRTVPGWEEQHVLLAGEGVRFLPDGRVNRAVFNWRYAADEADCNESR